MSGVPESEAGLSLEGEFAGWFTRWLRSRRCIRCGSLFTHVLEYRGLWRWRGCIRCKSSWSEVW